MTISLCLIELIFGDNKWDYLFWLLTTLYQIWPVWCWTSGENWYLFRWNFKMHCTYTNIFLHKAECPKVLMKRSKCTDLPSVFPRNWSISLIIYWQLSDQSSFFFIIFDKCSTWSSFNLQMFNLILVESSNVHVDLHQMSNLIFF